MHQRKRKRRIGHLRAVGNLADIQIIAHQQTFFHRRGGNHVHLENEYMHYRSHHRSEDDCLDPLHYAFIALVAGFELSVVVPYGPVEILRYVPVEDYRKAEQPPHVSRPHHEYEQIRYGNQRETPPARGGYVLEYVLHHNSNKSYIVYMPLRPRINSAARTAPRANPLRFLAVCVTESTSASDS